MIGSLENSCHYHPGLTPRDSLIPVPLPLPRAKGFQHQRMTNGAMNVEIGNPTYKMYEGGEPDDVGGLLDADFALDPDKVGWEDKRGGFQGRDKRLWMGCLRVLSWMMEQRSGVGYRGHRAQPLSPT